jgi:PAS domain S-box-containing protein
MRFSTRLDFKLVSISAVALLIVLALAVDSISDLVELKHLARAQMRDARHGTFNADFDVELVRAAGEAASFATTGNDAYLREAHGALERGEAALTALGSMLADKSESHEMRVERDGFITRQRQLFAQVKQGVQAAKGLTPGADSAQTRRVLNEIYAYEPASAQLRLEIVNHRDKDFVANERAMENRAHHTIVDFLSCLALFIFFMSGLVFFTRRAIVRPLNSIATAAAAVAHGDFNQKVAATGRDEVKRLQVAFNEMVSSLRRQHGALAESESRFRQMAEHFPGVFIMGNAAGTDILYVSPGYRTLWGTSVESLYRQPTSFVESIHPDDRGRAQTEMKKLDQGEACSQEYRIVRPDGSVRWVWDRAFPIKDAQGQLYRVAVVCEDVTERKLMEEELRLSERQLHAAFAEREEVNRDLHDDVLQSIYAVGLTLEGVRRAIQPDSATAKERVKKAIGQLNDIMRNVRLYILAPEARLRTTQDVMSALHALIHTAQGTQAPSVSAEVDPRVMPSLPEEHARNLLQIVREAISNAQRHARAQRVKVSLMHCNGHPRLTISDDGCGFEANGAPAAGHGLRNMAVRARLMGARLEILSQLGLGTQIAVDLPQPA